jgi:hypothetical protein
MGKKWNAYRVLVGKPERKRSLGELNLGRRIILRWIFKELDGIVWTLFI